MRVLIVGEYSAFAKELKVGFVKLGYQCTVFSWGDGAKAICQSDEDYSFQRSYFKYNNIWLNRLTNILNNLRIYKIIHKLRKNTLYNAVLIINPSFIRLPYCFHSRGLTKRQINHLKEEQAPIYLSACGEDFVFHHSFSTLRLHIDISYYKSINIEKEKRQFLYIFDSIKSIIPTHYDYAACYRLQKEYIRRKLGPTIPLPLNVSKFVCENKIENEIIIFLGQMRKEKGYLEMNEAVNRVIRKYNNVRRIPDRFLSFNEYLNELPKANVVIDQCAGYSYGMNALYAMAMGKCVMSNNEPECRDEYGVDEIPIINIKRDVDMIEKELSFLVEHPEKIIQIGKKARIYVEHIHDSTIVAKQYLNLIDNCSFSCNE